MGTIGGMSFNWLDKFHGTMAKADDYAEKTLAAYRLGMKAKGAIAGVRIEVDPECCAVCAALDESAVHHPDDAPHLPPEQCARGQHCTCVYRPVMNYELPEI